MFVQASWSSNQMKIHYEVMKYLIFLVLFKLSSLFDIFSTGEIGHKFAFLPLIADPDDSGKTGIAGHIIHLVWTFSWSHQWRLFW